MGVQVRSVTLVGAADWNWDAAHTVTFVHPRSVVADGAFDSYCVPRPAQTVRAEHCRSDVDVGAAVSYSLAALHCVKVLH